MGQFIIVINHVSLLARSGRHTAAPRRRTGADDFFLFKLTPAQLPTVTYGRFERSYLSKFISQLKLGVRLATISWPRVRLRVIHICMSFKVSGVVN